MSKAYTLALFPEGITDSPPLHSLAPRGYSLLMLQEGVDFTKSLGNPFY